MPDEEFEREKLGALAIPQRNKTFVGDRFNGVITPTYRDINDPVNKMKMANVYKRLNGLPFQRSFDARSLGLYQTSYIFF